jgi:AraC-like DNA-binding protein
MTSETGSDALTPRKPYGRGLAANYGVDGAAHIVSRVLNRAEFAVTELLAEQPPVRISDPIPQQDAYLICCQLRDRGPFEYWEGGRSQGLCTLGAGETTIRDLQRDPRAMTDGPLHSVIWLVSRSSLNALADEANVPYVDELQADPRKGVADETVRHLSGSILPALKSPEQVSRLFTDHVALAFATHIAQTYGGMQTEPRLAKGGLAPWQERRAKDMLAADLAGAAPLAEIAAACGLSPGHFARAFRVSTGLAPHSWLLRARVDHAMTLLRQRDPSLSEIALACGFADQSHLSRVFTRQIGMSPRSWRRLSIR